MAKVVINVKNNDLNNLKDNDVLMYDSHSHAFYKVTPEKFFNKYEQKLNALLERYDSQIKNMQNENARFREEMKNDFNNLLIKNKNTISKLITMVEEFIKGGK